MKKRSQYSAAFKAKVALAAIKEEGISELSSQFAVHGSMVNKWKAHLLKWASRLFEEPKFGSSDEQEAALNDALYRKIGQLEIELDFLKKKLDNERHGTMGSD